MDSLGCPQQVSSDLAILSGGLVITVALLANIRVIVGPFHNEVAVSSIFMVLQYFYTTMLSCIVSLQLTQVASVFWSAFVSELGEELIVRYYLRGTIGCSIETKK